jgi:hypothetical protein
MLRPGVDGSKEAEELAGEDAKQEELFNPPTPGPNELAGYEVEEEPEEELEDELS